MNYPKIKFILDEILVMQPKISNVDGVVMFGCGHACNECNNIKLCQYYFDDSVPNLRHEEAKYFIKYHPEFFI